MKQGSPAIDTMNWPPIGSRWREVDPRFGGRVVEVVAHDLVYQRVRIKYVRTTWAALHRFNGKRGGYARMP